MSTPERTKRKRKARREVIVGAFVLDRLQNGTLPEEIHATLKEGLPGFVHERDRDLLADFDLERAPDGD